MDVNVLSTKNVTEFAVERLQCSAGEEVCCGNPRKV